MRCIYTSKDEKFGQDCCPGGTDFLITKETYGCSMCIRLSFGMGRIIALLRILLLQELLFLGGDVGIGGAVNIVSAVTALSFNATSNAVFELHRN